MADVEAAVHFSRGQQEDEMVVKADLAGTRYLVYLTPRPHGGTAHNDAFREEKDPEGRPFWRQMHDLDETCEALATALWAVVRDRLPGLSHAETEDDDAG